MSAPSLAGSCLSAAVCGLIGPVDALVRENLFRWSNWTMQSNSAPYEKGDARTLYFAVKAPAEAE